MEAASVLRGARHEEGSGLRVPLEATCPEVADLSDRLETRKAVDRAKGVLQKELGLTEPDAFRWIQKTAMDLRLSMRQVADGVIEHGPGGASL